MTKYHVSLGFSLCEWLKYNIFLATEGGHIILGKAILQETRNSRVSQNKFSKRNRRKKERKGGERENTSYGSDDVKFLFSDVVSWGPLTFQVLCILSHSCIPFFSNFHFAYASSSEFMLFAMAKIQIMHP